MPFLDKTLFKDTHTQIFFKEFCEEGQCSGGNGKNKVNSRRAIKSRLFNVNVAEQKLKGNEAYVAGRSVESKRNVSDETN